MFLWTTLIDGSGSVENVFLNNSTQLICAVKLQLIANSSLFAKKRLDSKHGKVERTISFSRSDSIFYNWIQNSLCQIEKWTKYQKRKLNFWSESWVMAGKIPMSVKCMLRATSKIMLVYHPLGKTFADIQLNGIWSGSGWAQRFPIQKPDGPGIGNLYIWNSLALQEPFLTNLKLSGRFKLFVLSIKDQLTDQGDLFYFVVR